MKKILVYLQTKDNKIEDYSLDLITGAYEISKGEFEISGVAFGDIEIDKKALYDYGLDKLYLLKECDKTLYGASVLEAVNLIEPNIFLLTSTTEGREIAPYIAAKKDTGLTADCTKLEIKDYKLHSTRPTFGGKLMATILSRKSPEMATVRKNTFKKKNVKTGGEIEVIPFDIKPEEPLVKILEFIKGDTKEFYSLQNAKIVVAGGMGLKNKEGFEKLKKFASLTGANIGATRKAVDKGLIEREYQIGQTGKSTSPQLYIAFGISGAIHHVAGMSNSKTIISINTDCNAPIFEVSDFAIIKDANEVLDSLIEKVKA